MQTQDRQMNQHPITFATSTKHAHVKPVVPADSRIQDTAETADDVLVEMRERRGGCSVEISFSHKLSVSLDLKHLLAKMATDESSAMHTSSRHDFS